MDLLRNVGVTVPDLGPPMLNITRLTTGINRHLVPGRTGTLTYHLGGEETNMVSGSYTSTEQFSTSPETIERYPDSGNLD